MANKKFTFTQLIKNIFIVIPSILNLISNIAVLSRYEARLAGKSMVQLVILFVVVMALLTTTWGCMLGMLYLFLTGLSLSPALSLLILVLLNIFILLILGMVICRVKNNLTFPATRHQLAKLSLFRDD